MLWLQGWTSDIDKHYDGLIRMSNMSGVTFAMMETAGHGQHPVSLDDSTKDQQIAEVQYFYDFLNKEYENIIVVGGSFGGYLAGQLAVKSPAALVLRIPAIYDDREKDIPFGVLQDSDDYAERWNQNVDHVLDSSLKPLSKYRGMVYVVRHENDECIPRWIPDLYFRTAPRSNYLLVPTVGHWPRKAAEPQKYYNYIEKMVTDIVGLEIMAKEKEL